LLLAALLTDEFELLAIAEEGAILAGVLDAACEDGIDAATLLSGVEDADMVDPVLPPPPPHAVSKSIPKQASPLTKGVVFFIGTPSLLSFWMMRLFTNVTGYAIEYTGAQLIQIVR
jgi:hypothetical protein